MKKLTCMACKKTAEGFEEELFNKGWDFPGRFFSSPVVTCPNCPSAPLIIDWITELQIENARENEVDK